MGMLYFQASLVRLLITTICTFACLLSGIYGQPGMFGQMQYVPTLSMVPTRPIGPAFAVGHMGPVPPGYVMNPYLPMPVPNAMSPMNPMTPSMMMPNMNPMMPTGPMLATRQGFPQTQSRQTMVQPMVNPNQPRQNPGRRVNSQTTGQMRMATNPAGAMNPTGAMNPAMAMNPTMASRMSPGGMMQAQASMTSPTGQFGTSAGQLQSQRVPQAGMGPNQMGSGMHSSQIKMGSPMSLNSLPRTMSTNPNTKMVPSQSGGSKHGFASSSSSQSQGGAGMMSFVPSHSKGKSAMATSEGGASSSPYAPGTPLTFDQLDKQLARLENMRDLLEAQEGQKQAEAALSGSPP